MEIEAIISSSFDQISARKTSCRYKELVSIEFILLLGKENLFFNRELGGLMHRMVRG
jgi:hypothetical protein